MNPLKTKQQLAQEQKVSNARERQIAKQYLSAGPSISNLYNAFTHWYNSVPFLGGQPENGLQYIAGEPIILPGRGVSGLKNYPKAARYTGDADALIENPVSDILSLKIPARSHTSLGKSHGNKYRALGNSKALKDVVKNGVRAPEGQFSKEGKVFWNDGYLDRSYQKNGVFSLVYDKNGQAQFFPGGKPQRSYVYSDNNTPIDFFDPALSLHARIPFTQKYVEVEKTEDAINKAMKYDKINRYVEKPIHALYNWGLKPYVGYKLYDHYFGREDDQ